MKRVLLDENVPHPLKRLLRPHDVDHVSDRAWAAISDRELLERAEAEGFDVLITGDQNMQHQQNFRIYKLSYVVLSSNSWPLVQHHVGLILGHVDAIQIGQVITVQIGFADRR